MMGYGPYDGVGWLVGGGLMMLPMLLFWIVPIALVIWAIGGWSRGQHPSARDETPLEILRRRYASGEITQQEFDEAKRALA